MARRFDRDKEDVLSEQDLKQLRENLSRLSPQGVRDFYDRAHEDCRLIYTRLSTPGRSRRWCKFGRSCGSGNELPERRRKTSRLSPGSVPDSRPQGSQNPVSPRSSVDA